MRWRPTALAAQFIDTRPIMDMFLVAYRRPGSQLDKRWWLYYGLDLEGMRTAAWEAEQTEKGGLDGQDSDREGINRW